MGMKCSIKPVKDILQSSLSLKVQALGYGLILYIKLIYMFQNEIWPRKTLVPSLLFVSPYYSYGTHSFSLRNTQ